MQLKLGETVFKKEKRMAQRERKERITKKEWYALGGFANGDLFRKQSRGGAWRYYRALDNGRRPA